VRPLRLTLKGFRSYAGEESFDFRERGLVGIVGPIGSGKSSLLDGFAFALYGKTPTLTKETKGLINQRRDSAQVELWFEVDGQTWRAVRALRRKGQGAHSLVRHTDLDPGSERIEEVHQERAMTARVEELLGLDFRAFGRSVMLAQGQFAQFLEATGRERDDVLKGVFGLDRLDAMQEVAKTRRDAAARDLEELQRRREAVEADKVDLRRARERLAELEAASSVLDDARPRLEEIEAVRSSAIEVEEHAAIRSRDLNEMAAKLPARKAAAKLLGEAAAGAAVLEKSESVLSAAVARSEEVNATLERLVAESGGRDEIARIQAKVQRADELGADAKTAAGSLKSAEDDAEAALAAASEERSLVVASRRAHERAEEDRAVAKGRREEAAEALHAARHSEMAASLRAELGEGRACPVCGQEVPSVPTQDLPADVSKAAAAADAAAEAETEAERALATANTNLAETARRLAAAAARSEEAASRVEERRQAATSSDSAHAEVLAELGELLGSGDPRRLLAARVKALSEAEEARESSATATGEATEAVDAARQGRDTSRAEMQQLATEVAVLADRLGLDLEPGPEPALLGEALETLRAAWDKQSADTAEAAKEAKRQREDAEGGLHQLLKELGLHADSDFAEAVQRSRSDVAAAAKEIELLDERLARVAQLEEENAETLERHGVYARLAEDLTPSRFLSFLLDEERSVLADLAGERFEMLSGGRFRFTPDGSFDIVDLTAAESVRKARSLSGGETFLASLALALALAEMVTREGGRLDAFFLDEGFGSLDAEHLDLAMEGVERLVSDEGDRLVLVVSHVPELRQRVEDLVVLDKDPVTGDTRVQRA
jgi:exonuclease SbcC